MRGDYSDERWLEFRLGSVPGLAAHQVLSALRSCTAALVEHVAGTDTAVTASGLAGFKTVRTGNVMAKLTELADNDRPTVNLTCSVQDWLTGPDAWSDACRAEFAAYRRILDHAGLISDARERTKAKLLASLAVRHERVLAFDSNLPTLEVLRRLLTEHPDHSAAPDNGSGWELCLATGANSEAVKQRFTRTFGRTSTATAIGLCAIGFPPPITP